MSDPRFSIIPADAVLDKRLEPRDLQVLCIFGKHTDKRGWCRRSQVVMAKEIGCARSTVQASIDRLVVAGWLEKRPQGELHTPGVRDSAHEYRVVLDVPDAPQDVVDTVPTDRHPLPPQDRHPLPTHGSAPMLTTPSNAHASLRSASGGGRDVDAFRSELASLLDSDLIETLVQCRRKKRAAINGNAGALLVKALQRCPDPRSAAEEMAVRGWTSVKPEWLERSRGSPQQGSRNVQSTLNDLITRMDDANRSEQDNSPTQPLALGFSAYR